VVGNKGEEGSPPSRFGGKKKKKKKMDSSAGGEDASLEASLMAVLTRIRLSGASEEGASAAQQQAQATATAQACLTALKELRDRLGDAANLGLNGYERFLQQLLPRLQALLDRVPPGMGSSETARMRHEVRSVSMELLQRLPQNEALRHFVPGILGVLSRSLRVDNEENVLTCLSVLTDLNKMFRPAPGNQLELNDLFMFVTELYTNAPRHFMTHLTPQKQQEFHEQELQRGKASSESSSSVAETKDDASSVDRGRPNVKGTESFKVLTETPLLLMLLYQLHRNKVAQSLFTLMPMMLETIQIPVALPVVSDKKIREMHAELMSGQVRTLSLLAFLLRSSSLKEVFRGKEEKLAQSILNMFRACLPEMISTRKDLLVATRHVLATEFKEGFLRFVDDFLDESVLLGGGAWLPKAPDGKNDKVGAQPVLPGTENLLIPLAYSTLADLIHFARPRLEMYQVAKVLYIFSRNIHDVNVPLNTQTMSVRVLLNIVDKIFHNHEQEEKVGNRHLLVHIFHTMVKKFGTLRFYIPEVVSEEHKRRANARKVTKHSQSPVPIASYYFAPYSGSPPTSDENTDVLLVKIRDEDPNVEKACILGAHPSNYFEWSPVMETDSIKDLKSLIGTMMLGLKTVLWCVCNYGSKRLDHANPGKSRSGMTGLLGPSETEIVVNLLQWGFQCLPLYRKGVERASEDGNDSDNDEDEKLEGLTSEEEVKAISRAAQTEIEIINHFAEVFTVLDSYNFSDLFQAKMPLLVANISRHPMLIAFPKRLLRKNGVSHAFMRIVLDFILDRFVELAGEASVSKRNLAAAPDLSDLIRMGQSNQGIPFKNVPEGGHGAAASQIGLGLARQAGPSKALWSVSIQEESNDRKRPASESAKKSMSAEDYPDLLFSEDSNRTNNMHSVLSQLVEVVFACVESYTEDVMIGQPPSSLGESKISRLIQKPQTPVVTIAGGLTPGWMIAKNLQARIEKLLVLSLVLAPTMTSSPLAGLRFCIDKSPIQSSLTATTSEDSVANLLNAPFSNEAQGTSELSVLGRDCFLITLRTILRVIARRTVLGEFLKPKLAYFVVPALQSLSLLLLQASGKCRVSGCARKDVISELVLLLAMKVPRSELRDYIPLLQNGFEVALAANDHRNTELVRLALRILESWVDNLGPDEFRSLFLRDCHGGAQGNRTFTHAIAHLLRPSPQPCGTGALRVLGKLGRRARRCILEAVQLPPPAPGLPKALVVEMQLRQLHSKSFDICLDQVIYSTCDYLEEALQPNLDPMFIEHLSQSLDDAAVARSPKKMKEGLNSSSRQTDAQAMGKMQKNLYTPVSAVAARPKNRRKRRMLVEMEDSSFYKRKAAQFLFACLAQMVQKDSIGDDVASPPNTAGRTDFEAFLDGEIADLPFANPDEVRKILETNELNVSRQELLIKILHGLFTCCCDHFVGSHTWPMFHGVMEFLMMTGMSIQSNQHDGKSIPALVVNEVIVGEMCKASFIHSRLALVLLHKRIEISKIFHSPKWVLEDLLDKFCQAAQSQIWTDRLGAAFGLRIMMCELGSQWTADNVSNLTSVFAFLLETFKEPLGLDVLLHASSGLQELILLAPQEISSKTTLKFLIEALTSSSIRGRIMLRRSLLLIAKILELELGTLLKRNEETVAQVQKLIFSRPIRKRSISSQIAILETLAFLLDQEPCPIRVNEDDDVQKRISQVLMDAVLLSGIAEKSTKFFSFALYLENVLKQNSGAITGFREAKDVEPDYPFHEVPKDVLVRIAAMNCIRAVFDRGGQKFIGFLSKEENTRSVRDRAVTLAITSSLSCWPSIVRASQGVLQVVAANRRQKQEHADESLVIPSALVSEQLQKAMQYVSSEPNLSCSMLQGVLNIVETFHKDPAGSSIAVSVATGLTERLSRILTTIPAPDPLTVEGEIRMEKALQHLSLASEILRVLAHFPEKYIFDHLGGIIANVLRLEKAVEKLTLAQMQAGIKISRPDTAPFHEVHGSLSSPLRDPFQLVSHRFPEGLLKVLVQPEALRQPDSCRLLKHLLASSSALRQEIVKPESTSIVIKNMLAIIFSEEKSSSPTQRELIVLCFQGVDLIWTVVQHLPNWLVSSLELFDALLAVWRNECILGYLALESQLTWHQREHYNTMCKIFVAFFRYVSRVSVRRIAELENEEVVLASKRPVLDHLVEVVRCAAALPFELLTLAVLRTTTDTAMLLRFLRNEVASNESSVMRVAVLNHFIELVNLPQPISPHIREASLHLIVIPALNGSKEDPAFESCRLKLRGERILGEELVKEITGRPELGAQPEPPANRRMFLQPQSLIKDTKASREGVQIQLLKLATFLIENFAEELTPHRKDLIKFAWGHLKNEGSMSKHWAYLMICTFINVYETASDIILQVFVALLREQGSQSKHLITNSLDALVPALVKRLKKEDFVRAVRWTKKKLSDDGHKVPQSGHIWKLVVRHPGIFFQQRDGFLPLIVASLNKLWSPQNSNLENRKLAVGLAEVFIKWELTKDAEALVASGGKTVDPARLEAANEVSVTLKGNSVMLSSISNFLLRVSMLLAETKDFESHQLQQKSINLLNESFKLAVNAQKQQPLPSGKSWIKFSYVLKHLEQIVKKNVERGESSEAILRRAAEAGSGAATSPSGQSSPSKVEIEEAKDLNLKETSRGLLGLIIRIIVQIVKADHTTISGPFLREYGKDLVHLVPAVFGSAEKGIREEFLKLVIALRRLSPLLARPLSATISVTGDAAIENGSAATEVNVLSDNMQHFFSTLTTEVDKRLQIAADDGKTAALKALEAHKRQTMEQKPNKSKKVSSHSKQAIQRAAKAAALRKAREMGAGPKGTFQTLQLVQLLCGKDVFDVQNDAASNSIRVVSDGENNKTIDRLIDSLAKILQKLTRDLATSAQARFKQATKTAQSLGGSPSVLASVPRSPDQNRDFASSGICILINLLGKRVLAHDVHRKSFLGMMHAMLDKLDVHDESVLHAIVSLSAEWIAAPFPPIAKKRVDESKTSSSSSGAHNRLSVRERQQLMARLEQIERFEGMPHAQELLIEYHELVCRLYDPNVRDDRFKFRWVQNLEARVFAMMASSDIQQRRSASALFSAHHFPTQKGPFAKLQFLMQRDWSHMSLVNWLPVALKILLSAVNDQTEVVSSSMREFVRVPANRERMEVDDDDWDAERHILLGNAQRTLLELLKMRGCQNILESMEDLAFGDRSFGVARAIWMEVFPQSWQALEEQEKMVMTEGFQVFIARPSHLSFKTVYFCSIQTSAVVVQHALDEIGSLVTLFKARKLRDGVASDPFQEHAQIFALRRVSTWIRLLGWDTKNYAPRCFLDSLRLLEPLPILSAELLAEAGERFSAKSVVIEICERLLSRQSDSPTPGLTFSSFVPTSSSKKRSKKKRKQDDQVLRPNAAETNVYRWTETLLSTWVQEDEDFLFGLYRSMAKQKPSTAGLVAETTGNWQVAQEIYQDAIRRAEAGSGFYIVARKASASSKQNQTKIPVEEGEDLDIPLMDEEMNGIFDGDFGDVGMMDNGPENPTETGDLFTGFDFSNGFEINPVLTTPSAPQESSSSSSTSAAGSMRPNMDNRDVLWIPVEVSTLELDLWKKRWEECTKQLGHWDDLGDYATAIGDSDTVLECAARMTNPDGREGIKTAITNELQAIVELRQQISQDRPNLPLGTQPLLLGVEASIMNVSIVIQDSQSIDAARNNPEPDQVWRQAANTVLLDWATEGSSSGPMQQRRLLLACQRLVELEESISYLNNVVEVASASVKGGSTNPQQDLRSVHINRMLQRWRQRTPSVFEDPWEWEILMKMRENVFMFGTASFRAALRSTSKSSKVKHPGLEQLLSASHDVRWTVLERAKALRKIGMVDESLSILGNQTVLNQSRLSSEETFVVLRERVLNVLQCEKSSAFVSKMQHAAAILEQLLEIEFSTFTPENMAEMYRLRANLHDTLKDDPTWIHELYAQSVLAFPVHGASWLDWALFVDRLIIEQQGEEQEGSLAQMLAANILQAIVNGSDTARLLMPKIFWRLHMEDQVKSGDKSASSVASLIEMTSKLVPAWLWLPWLPQVIACIGNNGTTTAFAKSVLESVMQSYPDSVYYLLRAHYFDKEQTGADNEASAQARANKRVIKEILDKGHHEQGQLTQELEAFIEGIAFAARKTSPQEELLSTMHRLSTKCIQVGTSLGENENSRIFEVWHMLERVYTKFFSDESMKRSEEYESVLNKVKSKFEADFLVPNLKERFDAGVLAEDPSLMLPEVLLKIERWKNLLLRHLTTSQLPLFRWSRVLSTFRPGSMRIPGMHDLKDEMNEPEATNHAKLAEIDSIISLRRSDGYTEPCIGLVAPNGKVSRFLVKLANLTTVRMEHRALRLKAIMNFMFSRTNFTRRKEQMRFAPNVIVPVHMRLALQHHGRDSRSYEEVFEESMRSYGIHSASARTATAIVFCNEGYEGVVKRVHPEVLVSYIRNQYSAREYQTVRSLLARKFGLSASLDFLMSCPDRSPARTILKLNGEEGVDLVDFDLRPRYTDGHPGHLLKVEELGGVPFRLTRCMSAFLTPSGVNGAFENSLLEMAACMEEKINKRALRSYLELMILYDVADGNDGRLLTSEHLQNAVRQSVELMCKRISKLATRPVSADDSAQLQEASTAELAVQIPAASVEGLEHHEPSSSETDLRLLIAQAQDPQRLARMNASWLAWF